MGLMVGIGGQNMVRSEMDVGKNVNAPLQYVYDLYIWLVLSSSLAEAAVSNLELLRKNTFYLTEGVTCVPIVIILIEK